MYVNVVTYLESVRLDKNLYRTASSSGMTVSKVTPREVSRMLTPRTMSMILFSSRLAISDEWWIVMCLTTAKRNVPKQVAIEAKWFPSANPWAISNLKGLKRKVKQVSPLESHGIWWQGNGQGYKARNLEVFSRSLRPQHFKIYLHQSVRK